MELDFIKLKENITKLKVAEEDLKAYLDNDINIEMSRDKLLESDSNKIVYKLQELNFDTLKNKHFSKVAILFNNIDQHDLSEFRNFFKEKYSKLELEEKPEKPEEVNQESIREYNKELKEWNKRIDKNKEWNRNFQFLVDTLNDTITIDLYGDTSLDPNLMRFVYFKFFDTEVRDIEVFLQEIRNSPSESVQNIRMIEIVDVSSTLPSELDSADEVRIYFDNESDAVQFRENEDVVFSIFEKFIIRNDTMKKSGADWGLDVERKDNVKNSNPFQQNPNTIPQHNVPVNNAPSSEDWFDECEVNISECVYCEKMYDDGQTVFVIVPSEFFAKYDTILNNPKLQIKGISDDYFWDRKNDGSYHNRKGEQTAREFLEENCLGMSNSLETLVLQIEESKLEDLTEDEVYEKYSDGTNTFKPYDLEFEFLSAGDELSVKITPYTIPDYDQHVPLARDIFDKYTLAEDMETYFSIWVGDSPLKIKYSEIKEAYNLLTGIGMTPTHSLEDFLKEVL